uniref:NADH-ubiquinone oxidoreductase chain 3 n=1 Tax=Pomphorhynchus laevis TaxID=141832 RepID=A0A806GM98_9BILA|nr:NADH dehydrogenase subunit 3 [Pomphorhynchus laevis]
MSVIVGVVVAAALVILLSAVVWVVLNRHVGGVEALTSFECGSPSQQGENRQFSVRFFALVLVFLLLDLEVALILLMPAAVLGMSPHMGGCLVMTVILYSVGTFYEWHSGSLSWVY